MSPHISTEPQNQATRDGKLPITLSQLISSLASSLVVLGFFAYLIGWNFMTSYLSQFGASWLIIECPPALLLKQTHIIVLIIGALVSLIAIKRILTSTGLFSENLRRELLRYGSILPLSLLCIKEVLKKWFPDSLLSLPAWLSLPAFMAVTMLMLLLIVFDELIFQLSSRKDQLNIRPHRHAHATVPWMLTFAALLWGMYSVPDFFARVQARIDKNPSWSKLPILIVKRDANTAVADLRLILVTKERFYGVQLNNADYPITVFAPDEIISINRSSK